MSVRVIDTPLEPWREVAAFEATQKFAGKVGAACVFVGTMRDYNQDTTVRSMVLEHYPAMTERELEAIGNEAARKWTIEKWMVVHRHGALQPSDPIVLVAAWSGHREQAFAACRYIIEALKTRAPFWKQEQTENGARWVERQT
ncbi:MAG: molybdenum cofactor biosynthesis protein MoaE [Pseudomonadota bacterium]|nr:MAG: molybdenum cofactor biosynthesis protein MoaE [Pseudomonadota bacterium]